MVDGVDPVTAPCQLPLDLLILTLGPIISLDLAMSLTCAGVTWVVFPQLFQLTNQDESHRESATARMRSLQ